LNIKHLGIPPLRPYQIPVAAPGSLGVSVRAYKASVTYRINVLRGMTDPPVWQRNYYEHIIRDEKEYNDLRNYIDTNPLNWTDDQINPFPILARCQ
jgi:putative transposase